MELARVGALECVGCLPDPVVSCGTAVCCIVQVEVLVEVTEITDELQRLLGGSVIGLECGWHEDEAFFLLYLNSSNTRVDGHEAMEV
jgi:hypothetical protein